MTNASETLLDAAVAAMPGWVQRCVHSVLGAQSIEVTPDVERATEQASLDAQSWTAELLPPVLATNDPQHVGTPLTVIRAAARFPTAVLRQAGAAELQRDDYARRHFPEDVFDLTPASWADIDDALVDPAIRWGAARVRAHLDSRPGQ